MAVRPDVSYTPYAIYSREQTGDIITFTQFEEGDFLSETQNLLSENRYNTESGNESDDDSTMPPLTSEENIYAIYSGDEYDAKPISTEMLEDIFDGSHSHPSVNRRDSRYKICYRIKQGQSKCKVSLLSTQNMGKGLHEVFKAVVNEIS